MKIVNTRESLNQICYCGYKIRYLAFTINVNKTKICKQKQMNVNRNSSQLEASSLLLSIIYFRPRQYEQAQDQLQRSYNVHFTYVELLCIQGRGGTLDQWKWNFFCYYHPTAPQKINIPQSGVARSGQRGRSPSNLKSKTYFQHFNLTKNSR